MAHTPKRKILFVTPPYHCGVVEVAGTWPPLGFGYLGAQAERAGWEAQLYDAMSLQHELKDIEQVLRDTEFDVIASTAITPTFPAAAQTLALAKKVRPECTTLIGGVHPTFCFNEILSDQNNQIDYIIAGEGELPLYNFLKNFADQERRHETPNLMWTENGEVKVNKHFRFMENIDELPVAWHLFDWSLYKYYVIDDSILGAVSTSRGCNHRCSFCSQQKFWKHSWRGRAPECVVAEMKHLHDTYGVNVFLFTDEYPTLDRRRWEALMDQIIAANLNSYILMETRVEDIVRDEDILEKYRTAGVIHVYVGAEATEQETLDRVKKEISVSDSQRALELIAEYGMISETSFVLGFPEETAESIEKTFQAAKSFNPDFAHFLAITPWPYADFHKEVAEHIETHDYSLYNLIEPIIKPLAMTRRDVDRAIIECYARFYMEKIRVFKEDPNPFRREYLMTSTKLIMKSSFLIGKL
ncbi:MAG TPA: radical SAM protein, partial [candidate division Zixibacteria bacterium]|nr:radical SAM protein [candidate division Zixibacteria bacterium]